MFSHRCKDESLEVIGRALTEGIMLNGKYMGRALNAF